jgi:Uma2 family endonuclease
MGLHTMTTQTPTTLDGLIEYPDQDGQPLSDNTLQFQWIVTIQGNLDGMFRNDASVFVAGDLLWYAVEGHPEIRTAPDTMVVFGRRKGYRGSYMQWREDNIAPQVVFEVYSPGNRPGEMQRKFDFYERYGVEEYYLYDPDRGHVSGWIREGDRLRPIPQMDGWTSPRLGIRFDLSGQELVIYDNQGQPFLTFTELKEEQQRARQVAEHERQAREQAEMAAGQERQAREQAEKAAGQERRAREQAEKVAGQERQTREELERRAERLAEQLRSLGVDPESL